MMQTELEKKGKIYRCQISDLKPNELTAKFATENVHIRFEKSESDQKIEIQLDGEPFTLFVSHPEPGKVVVSHNTHTFEVTCKDILPAQAEFNSISAAIGEGGSKITSPMPGKVIKVAVQQGAVVAKGDLLLVVEAMKMENNILSPADAVADRINVVAGDLVDSITTLIHLSARPAKQSAD
jgi:acetyl/propionyl-CoA carboxylase alpha subunit